MALQQTLRGILWMFVYAAVISVMHATVRLVGEGMHPFEVAFFRNLFGLVPLIPWFIKYGSGPLKTGRIGLLAVRGAMNTVCMLAFFSAMTIGPLVDAVALSFTAPIFATFMAMFIFADKVGPRRWIAIGFAFAGVMVILRPGFVEIGVGQTLALAASVGWALCLVMVRDLGRTESAVTITAYMSIMMAPLSLPFAIWVWQWPSAEQWGWLVLVGIAGGLGQFAMSQAFRLAPNHVLAPVDFTRLLFVSALAYLIFGDVPDEMVVIGGAMILGATAFITYREYQTRRKA
ncbi:MAG: DMT family transporter [Magnetospiraceae bacterium]